MADEEKQTPEEQTPAPEPAPEPETPAETPEPQASEAPDVPTSEVSENKPNTSGVVESGNTIKVHYKGTLEGGEVFDSSEGKDPLEFKVGQNMVIKGFDAAVVGMKTGEKKSITIQPADAYGEPQPDLNQKVPKEAFGDIKDQLEVGMQLALNHPQAPGPIPVKVTKIEDDGVTIDMNHPLAGKTLSFDIEVVDIN